MCRTGIEKEVEICATNLTNKTKCMSTNFEVEIPSVIRISGKNKSHNFLSYNTDYMENEKNSKK
jgi:hypothetical protein